MSDQVSDILIADAGSTKTDWAFLSMNGEELLTLRTGGINAVHTPTHAIESAIEKVRNMISPVSVSETLRILFFGAGCANATLCQRIEEKLLKSFPGSEIRVESDLAGAALSLLGDEKGVACILGTGSNSGLWENGRIKENTPPLGFILGDEGSGAALGKRLINSLFKNEVSEETKNLFLRETGLDLKDIIKKVYREEQPARFLASLAPFLNAYIEKPELKKLALEEFELFFRRNVNNYKDVQSLPIALTGSIACHFKEVVIEAARRCNLHITKITQEPLSGLIDYFKTSHP